MTLLAVGLLVGVVVGIGVDRLRAAFQSEVCVVCGMPTWEEQCMDHYHGPRRR